jgi:cytochrome P450
MSEYPSRTPVHLKRTAVVRLLWRALHNPIDATRRLHSEFGPFVVIRDALSFVSNARLVILTADPEFNAEVLSNPAVWRPIGIFPGGPKNSSAKRLSAGLSRMSGQRHAYYRGLLIEPLRKDNVHALSDKLADLVANEVATWPVGETFDLWERVRYLMHTLAIGLLFGGDWSKGYPIANMITHVLSLKWSPSIWTCPINLPFTPYGQLLRESEALERCILDWANTKRGRLDPKDFLSIIVNNPEEDGIPARNATIVGQVPQLFGAAFETCQNVLIWTLILLSQHPRIASDLLKSLKEHLKGASPSLKNVADLPLLDAVIKESLRVLPPVPFQIRVAQQDTFIAAYPVSKGARVLLNAFLTNRKPGRYPEADSFMPERWSSIQPTAFEYLVFSGGSRNCPGYWLATAMMKVALSTILLHYRIELSPQSQVDYRAWPVLTPRAAISAMVHRQDGKFAAASISGNVSDLVKSMQHH